MSTTLYSIAAPNIALIKYWGKGDCEMNLPAAGSISLTLSSKLLWTATRIVDLGEIDALGLPTLTINGVSVRQSKAMDRFMRGFLHCVRLKGISVASDTSTTDQKCTLHQCLNRITIESHTNLPIASGLASSAAGAAALALAVNSYCNANLDTKTISCLARLYSGSGARSLYPGAVEMVCDPTADPLFQWYAIPISVHPSLHSLECLIVPFSDDPKPIPSTEAMNKCHGHPLQLKRLAAVPERLARCRHALETGNFAELAAVSEEDWRCMHNVIENAAGIKYVTTDGYALAAWITELRNAQSLQAFCTYDAGSTCIIFGHPEALQWIQKCQSFIQCTPCKIEWVELDQSEKK